MISHFEYRRSTVSIYQQTKQGQLICGDTYYVTETDHYLIVSIADGLGSGQRAHESAEVLVQFVEQYHHQYEVDELILHANERVRGTRGCVIGMMKIHFSTNLIDYVGIGNVQMVIADTENRWQRSISKPGYLVGRPIQVRKYQFAWKHGSVFVMHSDGVDLRMSKEEKRQLLYSPKHWLESNGSKLCTNDDATIIVGCTH